PLQKEDFKAMLRVMQGFPVTIRLLDPPLHEFLPSEEEIQRQIDMLQKSKVALDNVCRLPKILRTLDPQLEPFLTGDQQMLNSLARLQKSELDKKLETLQKIRVLKEVNPMLGHRGVRLGITYPEIYETQVEAILEAAAELIKESVAVKVEIMVPNKFGSMIEVVRACMRAGKLAEMAEFFSFGTNDLTQATFSFSREDAENKFLPLYNQLKILQDNPFEILDVKGVGRLMSITVEWGRRSR